MSQGAFRCKRYKGLERRSMIKFLKLKNQNTESKSYIKSHFVSSDNRRWLKIKCLTFNQKSLPTCGYNNLFWEYVPYCLSRIVIFLNFTFNMLFKFTNLCQKQLPSNEKFDYFLKLNAIACKSPRRLNPVSFAIDLIVVLFNQKNGD